MKRVRWTIPAAEDLEVIKNYLQLHSPQFAESTVRTIYRRIRSLKRPLTGADRVTAAIPESWRCRPLPYVVVTVKEEAIEILHIYHGAQDWY